MKPIVQIAVLLATCSVVSALVCLKCSSIPHPRYCSHVEECFQGEKCGAIKELNSYGEYVFNIGCLSDLTCPKKEHEHSPLTESCQGCCETDLCNVELCAETGYSTDHGRICYNCEGYSDPRTCHDIEMCLPNEVCGITARNMFGEVVYSSKCLSKHDYIVFVGSTRILTSGDLTSLNFSIRTIEESCRHAVLDPSTIIGKRSRNADDRRAAFHTCDLCCETDLCNRDCHSALSATMTTRYPTSMTMSMTTRPPTSTTTYRMTTTSTRKPTTVTTIQPTDCRDVLNQNSQSKSGYYNITTWRSHTNMIVKCDMVTDGGGWTIVQNRNDRQVNFTKTFSQYEQFFGNITTEFWLGLTIIQELAAQQISEIRLEMTGANGKLYYEQAGNFSLAGPEYILHVSQGHGNAVLEPEHTFTGYQNAHPFSTADHGLESNCARASHAGFWYASCNYVDLNYVTLGALRDNRYGFPYNDANTTRIMIRRA